MPRNTISISTKCSANFPSSQTSRPLSRPTHVSEAWPTSGFVLQVALEQPCTITTPPRSHLLHASFTSSQGVVYCDKHLFILQGSPCEVVQGDSHSVTHDEKNLYSLYAPRGGCMSLTLRNHVARPFIRPLHAYICAYLTLDLDSLLKMPSSSRSRFPPRRPLYSQSPDSLLEKPPR